MNPLTPYLLWLKLGAAALAAALLLWAALTVRHWHQDSLRLSAAEAHAAQVEKDAAQTIAAMKAAYVASQKASEGYQNELEQIRHRPVPSSPVRLCLKPRVPAASPSASGSSAAVPAAGVVQPDGGTDSPVRAGPDIGPAMRSVAQRADEVSAQGRAIQGLK